MSDFEEAARLVRELPMEDEDRLPPAYKTMHQGPLRWENYARGYNNALRDVARALESRGKVGGS